MSKYVVSVFDDAKGAYDGARAVRELENEGTLSVYEGAIISKKQDGTVRVLDAEEEGPIGMLMGVTLGSLFGVLAGPAGLVVGAATGSLSGLLVDMHNVGVNDQFLDDVAEELTPGKYAVVAEVSEGWTAPLDMRIEKLGGKVIRAWRFDVEDDQIDREIEATDREFKELEEEWSQAKGEAKAKLEAKVEETRKRLKALDEKAKKKVESLKQQAEAKVKKLDEQINKASAEFKTKLETTRAEVKADYDRRIEKLKTAGQNISEALA